MDTHNQINNSFGSAKLSIKGQQLIEQYKLMAKSGYSRTDGSQVVSAYNSFELKKASTYVKNIFDEVGVKTVLDYGCGGTNWHETGFIDDKSAVDFFALSDAFHYEPARNIDERQKADCVISFDVLEHVFISDVKAVLTEMFSHAKKLVVLNVACYEAAALLPNGENAHITVRLPNWWKGALDILSTDFPDIKVCLLCSETYSKMSGFPLFSHSQWLNSPNFFTKP